MPLVTLLLFGAVGLLLLVLGFLIWKKQRISLIHSYHYTHVREEDKPAYTARMGQACLVMGTGSLLCGILFYLSESSWAFMVFGAFFLARALLMGSAQRRYNRHRP